jgi:hypothetical protein
MSEQLKPYLKRLGFTFLIALVFVLGFNEVTYRIQKEDTDRMPKTIEINIPAGTAERIAAGEAVSSAPTEMKFVIGDKLVVVNEDTVDHQLGPLWIPAGRSASLNLDMAANLSYQCSFAEGNYLGLDVRKPTTIATRITAAALAVPTMTIFLFIYSLVAYPVKTSASLPGITESIHDNP